MSSLWREKIRAFAIHFLITLALAAGAAALIFLVWFPSPMQTMTGGTQLFLLVVGCDLALGPLISLVIYNSKKSRRELITDYTVVGAIQLAALVYGVYVVSSSRPVYVAFVGDRYDVIAAADIADADLDQASAAEYRMRPKTGPRLVATEVPPQDRNEVLFSALSGKDVGVLPKYYVAYDSKLADVKARAQTLDELEKKHPEAKPYIEEALADLQRSASELRWLPIKAHKGFWTALIDAQTGYPVDYIPVDPY